MNKVLIDVLRNMIDYANGASNEIPYGVIYDENYHRVLFIQHGLTGPEPSELRQALFILSQMTTYEQVHTIRIMMNAHDIGVRIFPDGYSIMAANSFYGMLWLVCFLLTKHKFYDKADPKRLPIKICKNKICAKIFAHYRREYCSIECFSSIRNAYFRDYQRKKREGH